MVDIAVWHERDPAYVSLRLEDAQVRVATYFDLDRPWNSVRLSSLLGALRDECEWLLVSGGGVVSGEVWLALDSACAAARAIFTRASFPKGQERFRFMVGGRELVTKSCGPGVEGTTAADWLNALWLGLVARDRGLLLVLRDFEVEWMEIAAPRQGVLMDPYVVEWVRAWQMLLRGERGDPVAQQVLEVMRLTDPERAPVAGAELVLQVEFPSVRLLWDVVAGERTSFAGDVGTALEGHKEYFTRPVENRVRQGVGFVPWQLLGPVCAGVDSGFEVGVVSEYLPEALLFDRRGRAAGG